MRYDEIVSRSWTIVWRYRYLWLLGLLGGGEASVGFPGLGLPGPNLQFPGQQVASQPTTPNLLATWLPDHVALLATLGVLLLLYVLGYSLLSCATAPALVRAAAEHDAGRRFDLPAAWRVGIRTFPRILGLRLLVVLTWVVVLATLGALLGATIVLAAAHQVAASIVAGLFLAGLVLLLLPGAVALGLVVTLATRAIVLEQRGVLAALARGGRLLYRRLGRVLLVWLLGLALAIVAGLAVALAIVLLAAFLAAIGIGGFLGLGIPGGLTAAVILSFVFIVVVTPLAGTAGTYVSVYWTLAFRRLELEPLPPYPVVPRYPSPPTGVHPVGGP